MNLVNELLHESTSAALIDDQDVYSYQKINDLARSIATGLINDEHIKPDDRVVIIAHNSLEFAVSYLAVLIAGAVAIPLDPFSSDFERARDLSLVKPHLLIVSSREWIPDSYEENIPSLEFYSSRWRKYLEYSQAAVIERNDDDIAVMMMTSGSSFQPRPAMLTHGSMRENLHQAQSSEEMRLHEEDLVLLVLPMYHIFGLHVVFGFSLFSSATCVIARSFDPIELATLITSRKITVVPGVPALFDSFVREKSVTIDAFSNVRMLISGGAPMRSEMHERFKGRFGLDIAEGYGLTEASPMVSFTEKARVEGDIGKPLQGVEIDIRDKNGEVALDGDVGQIVVKGKNVFAGYFRDAKATAKVLDSNGWLFTGDIGVRNEDGTITLIDRSNDVIVVHGFSVFPSEVEKVLLQHVLVDKVAVVGELSETSGECVVAHVELKPQSQDLSDPKVVRTLEQELRDHCSNHLARYKVPSKFDFINDVKMTASSRPLRKSLRSAISNID